MTDNDSTPSNPKTASPPQDRTFAPERSLCDFESFEYHAEDDVYRALISDDSESASTAVVSAVAAASDTDLLDLDPLHSIIDTDALNALATPQYTANGDLHVTFEFHGHEVTASSCGNIKVRPLESPETQLVADD